MFGMALRAYIRKVRRLSEAQTDRGRTLWQAVLEFVRREGLVSRDRVLERFSLDGELLVSAVLHDLTESGVVFTSGSGHAAVVRAASDDELGRLSQLTNGDGFDELAWVLVYRHGPVSEAKLAELLGRKADGVADLVERLASAGRVQRGADGALVAHDFVIPLGSSVGWEAAVFDHIQAVIQTVCQRLQQASFGSDRKDSVGGSTYSFDIWPGHPLEPEVKGQLFELRQRLTELRQRVESQNRLLGLPAEYQQVVTYVGQSWIDREQGTEDEESANKDSSA
jgi:hypothetical protein